jgi:hypothetical protein
MLQIANGSLCLGQPEVAPPAAHIPAPLIAQFSTGATPSAVPHLANLRLESLQALRRYADPLLAIQSKAQELAALASARKTLPVPLLAAFTCNRRCFPIQS